MFTAKPNKKDIGLLSSILILTLLVNINLFNIPFIFDDYDFLFYWETIRDFRNIPSLLLDGTPPGHEGVYRPLRSIFYALSLRFFGHNIFFYHIQELVIYSLCIIFVYLITQKMFRRRLLSFLTALFYAMLSIHIDNVANLTANFDTIGVVFFFLSFYLFQHYIDTHKRYKNLLLSVSLITSFAAYATYEITIILPILIFLYTFYFRKKISPFIYLAFILCAASFLFIRINFLHISTRGTLSDNLLYKITNTTQSLAHYLLINFIPIKVEPLTLSSTLASLAFSQAKESTAPLNNLKSPSFFLSLIFLLTTIGIAITSYMKRKISGLGLLWFYTALLPAIAISMQSTFVKGDMRPLWPRYAIIASYGICLLLANWLFTLLKLHPKSGFLQYLKMSSITAIIALATLNAIASRNNLNNWKGLQPELLTKIGQLNKEEERHNDQGVIYAAQRKFSDSITEFQTALKINPKYTRAEHNLKKLCQIIKNLPKYDPKTKKSCPK